MQCAFCKESIDDDSFYCDMCGEEIKICPGCKKPGKGKVCTSCGTPLTTLKSQAGLSQGNGASTETPPTSNDKEPGLFNTKVGATGKSFRLPDEPPPPSAVPQLRLLNKNINVDLKIDNNSIIGRTLGRYAATFGGFDQVSSVHCRFDYFPAKGWCVTDLGSTNKTKYNSQELTPHTPQAISDQTYLKIANIEFYVRVIPG